VGLLDHMADLCLLFKEDSILFSKVVNKLTFPPAMYEGSVFPTSLLTFVFGGIFDDGYSNSSEVEF
jgi:hypothetical protein